MAKKETKTKVEETTQVASEVIETVVDTTTVEKPKTKRTEPKFKKLNDGWEIKDRMYNLKGKDKPLSFLIKGTDIFWFDEEKGYERELKYCENQRTCFVDEMKGEQRLSHIIFRSGSLFVPKNKTTLQKLLSLYHPHKGVLYEEWQPAKNAAEEIDMLELEVEALVAAKNIDIDLAEAIMRVEIGSSVSKMTSKELRRDLLVFAKRKPNLFLELAADENVQLRNFGIKAVELGIIKLSNDQRNFVWGSNKRKLMTVPFDEHPYTALAHWFKTDEGMEVYQNIEKRLKD
tara:strand:- start:2928 stop:3791 length:864 start_codon:yes stop_codon:yes gene_type:complete